MSIWPYEHGADLARRSGAADGTPKETLRARSRTRSKPCCNRPHPFGGLRQDMQNLEDRRVVVTGGSRGLGLGIVEALAARKATLTVVARDRGRLAEVERTLGVSTIAGDATDPKRRGVGVPRGLAVGGDPERRRDAGDGAGARADVG